MITYVGEIAALGTAICWSLTAVFFSYSGRRIGSNVVNRSRLLFALLWISFAHYLVEGVFFPRDAEPFRWGWLALSSVLGLVLGDTALFYAYVTIGPRLAMLLMSLSPILSALAGWILFGEIVGEYELIGIMLTIGGVSWVVTEPPNGQTLAGGRDYGIGIVAGILGALGQAANLVTARYGLVGGFSTVSATLIRLLVAAIILWSIVVVRGRVRATIFRWRDRRAFAAMMGGAFFGPFLGIWLSMIAIQLSRLGIASTLMALPPVILIPVEYFVYRQPVSWRSVLGTILAFVGVALIFLSA